MVGARIGIQTLPFPWLPLINYYKYQNPSRRPAAQMRALPGAVFLGSGSLIFVGSGLASKPNQVPPLPHPTNREAVADTPVVFLAGRFSGIPWWAGPLPEWNGWGGERGAGREGGERRDGRREVEWEGGRRGYGEGRVCDAQPR